MSDREFVAFPKIPRLNRDIVITEKIDGTNACVVITEEMEVYAQSRNRIITPEADNFGFARWVQENAEDLAAFLGAGRHFGEWYGAGIQRGYGLASKRFALFAVHRWRKLFDAIADGHRSDLDVPPGLGVVPVLYEGPLFTESVEPIWAPSLAITRLCEEGSVAVPGFAKPEGIVVFHTAAGQLFKVTCEGDEKPKGKAA